jgi:hypothetical protein
MLGIEIKSDITTTSFVRHQLLLLNNKRIDILEIFSKPLALNVGFQKNLNTRCSIIKK